MSYLKLKLDDDTYQYLKDKFDGDINAIEDFIKKPSPKKLKKHVLIQTIQKKKILTIIWKTI